MPTFEEVLSRLEAGLAIASEVGLAREAEESRFSRYREDLQRLVDLVRRRREGALTKNQFAAAVLERPLEYIVALSEGVQFGDILDQLADAEPTILKRKLRDTMRGPLLPSDEDANSNHARNTLFELALAARLKRAGFQPTLEEKRPDVTCRIDNRLFGFECKRVFSEAKVAERIVQASESLRSELEARGPDAGSGVIVISVAKLLSPAQVPFRIQSQEAAMHLLDRWLEAIGADTKKVWAPRIHSGPVVGIMFHVSAVFENDQRARFDVGEWWLGVFDRENEAVDGFRKLGEALKGAAY